MTQLETRIKNKKQRSYLWPVLRGLLFVFLFVSAVILGIFAFIYSQTGDNGYENPRITAWLQNKLQSEVPAPYQLSIQETRFMRGKTLSLSLRVKDVRLKNTQTNEELVAAPFVILSFDLEHKVTWKAAQNFFLTKIDIQDLSVNLPKDPPKEQNITSLFAALDKAKSVGFTDLSFNNIKLAHLPPLDFMLHENEQGQWHIAVNKKDNVQILSVTAEKLAKGFRLQAQSHVFTLDEILSYLPTPLDLPYFKGKAKAQGHFLFDEKGEPHTFKGDANFIEGQFEKRGKYSKTYLIPEAKAQISWAKGHDFINIETLDFEMRPWKTSLQGIVSFPKEGVYPLLITKGKLDVFGDSPKDAPVTLDSIMLKGQINPNAQILTIEQAALSGPVGGFTLSGKMQASETTPAIDLDLKSTELPHYAFLRLWPEMVSPKARQWIIDHVQAGTVEPATIKTAFPAGIFAPENVVLSREMLEIKANVRDVVIKPLDVLPAVKSPFTEVFLDGSHIKAYAAKGEMTYQKHPPFILKEVSFLIPDTAPAQLHSNISIKAESGADGLLDVFKLDLFKGVSNFAFDEGGDVKGQANSHFTLSLPLKTDVTKKEVQFKAEIDFNNFSQTEAVREFALEQGKVKVIATNDDFLLKGEGKIAGSLAQFEYSKKANVKKPRLNANIVLDDKARAKFGLDMSAKMSGRTPVKIFSEGEDSGIYKIEADLTQAKLNELIPGWVKPAGQNARAKLTVIEKDKGWRIEDLNLEGKNVQIKGVADFDESGALLSGNFPVYHLSDGDKASVRVDKIQNGHRVVLNATLIDIRSPLKNLLSTSQSTPDKSTLNIEAKVNVATGFGGEVIRGVTLKATRTNGEIRMIEAKGKSGQGEFSIEMIREKDKPYIAISTADAGAWLRFLDVYKGLYGGSLRLALSPPKSDGSIEAGSIEVKNFSIKDNAFSSLAATSEKQREIKNLSPKERQKLLQETAQAANFPSNTQFSRLKANFNKSPSQVLHIADGLIMGPAIGSTLEGNLDFKNNRIALSGTYVPMYALNNMFAQIPILGVFLGASPDEGLIGVSFDIIGSASKPELVINPLSAIAPGFLRRLVDFRGRNQAQQQE